MFVIVLNQNNLVPDGQNNKLLYKFPNSILFKDKYIAVSSIAMYYSWFNITNSFTNNTLTYTFTQVATTTTYTITIPDGLYEISDINAYCQFVMIANNTYWTDSSGQNVYPFDIVVNPNRYGIQLNTYLVPNQANAALAGFTPPSGIAPAAFWPTTEQNSVITFPASFNLIVGYPVGFASNANTANGYTPPSPTASSNYATKDAAGTLSYLSSVSPQVQPNPSILFSLSNINNPYTQPSSVIYSITPSVAIGEQIVEKPPNFMWNKMIDGTYNELRLTFLGSGTLAPIPLNDPNMTILLCIRDKDEMNLLGK